MPRLTRSSPRPSRKRVLWVLTDTSAGRQVSPDELGVLEARSILECLGR